MASAPQDISLNIQRLTEWLRDAPDLAAARVGFLLRQYGVDPKTCLCAKIFPNTADPLGGIVITPDKKVFHFTYNRAGMMDHLAVFDEWLNVTEKVMGHPWRDEILCGLGMVI